MAELNNNIRNNRRPNNRNRRPRRRESNLDRRVISVRRVAKVRAGAKRLRFSAAVVVGDRKGQVGVGLGRGADTRSAIGKAEKYASNHLVKMDLIGDTIPHEVFKKDGASKVMIKPAGPGTGVVASAPVRAVLEMAGVRNVLTKRLGSSNPVNNAYCTFEAMKDLDKSRIVKKLTKSESKTQTKNLKSEENKDETK